MSMGINEGRGGRGMRDWGMSPENQCFALHCISSSSFFSLHLSTFPHLHCSLSLCLSPLLPFDLPPPSSSSLLLCCGRGRGVGVFHPFRLFVVSLTFPPFATLALIALFFILLPSS